MLVVCAGMIRSGSTLQYNMARCLVEVMSAGSGQGFYEDPCTKETQRQFRLWSEDEAFHVVKVHRIPSNLAEMSEANSIRICYIFRDIRDVAASLKNMLKCKEESLVNMLDEAITVYYKMLEMKPVLWQKYEEVVPDVSASLSKVAGFLGLAPSEETLNKVAEMCSLVKSKKASNMLSLGLAAKGRSVLRKLGVPESVVTRFCSTPGYDKETLLHPRHISKNMGASGVWEEALSQEEIGIIQARYTAWLTKENYL